MKRLTLFLFIFLLLYPVTIYSQSSFDGCAPEGKRKKTAKNKTGKVPAKEAVMNRMKNSRFCETNFTIFLVKRLQDGSNRGAHVGSYLGIFLGRRLNPEPNPKHGL